jgi:UDP-3-O-[3-hydroxymyristoyl] glucosamine N-acyltransferase
MSLTLGELAVRFGCALRGDPQARVDHVAPLWAADPRALSFLANPRLSAQLAGTRAGAVVIESASAAACPVPALITPNPHALFARIATLLHPAPVAAAGVHPSAVVDVLASVDPSAEVGPLVVVAAGAQIGPRCRIGAGSYIGPRARIGADSSLDAHVTLEAGVSVGERALIHAGAVIGSDGFGLAPEDGRWLKVPQVGSVRIGADVEIGANTTIDRGAIEDTVIADGVKLDNLIQVGHNVHIGAHSAVAACTGISGSTRIGARCMIGGGVGFNGHIEICDDVVIAGMSTVTHSIREPGTYGSLIPAEPMRRWRRAVARLKLLADRDATSGPRGRRDRQQPDRDED